ncbi:protein kinase 4-like [Syngnathoides biaculeatus]|uniref:protein kinase 4-like n=1 Tax=Syngnathoides biaculeatus TaxID=300417 RepID=UPI002ADDD821|nr:protein kinase 4-like [Syngnathoides biaculeatus]
MTAVWVLVLLVHAVFMGKGLCFPGGVKEGESNTVLKKDVSSDDVSLKKVVELLDSLNSVLKLRTPAQPATKEVFQDKAILHERNDQQSYNMSSKGQLNDALSSNITGKGQQNDQQSYNMSGKGQQNDALRNNMTGKGQQNKGQQVQESINQNNKSSNQQRESFQQVQQNVMTDHNQQSEFFKLQQNDRLDDSTDEGFIVNV